jgi:hypothetical protein
MTAGTTFDRTRTPLTVWFIACWLFAMQNDGVSAPSMQRHWRSAAPRNLRRRGGPRPPMTTRGLTLLRGRTCGRLSASAARRAACWRTSSSWRRTLSILGVGGLLVYPGEPCLYKTWVIGSAQGRRTTRTDPRASQ